MNTITTLSTLLLGLLTGIFLMSLRPSPPKAARPLTNSPIEKAFAQGRDFARGPGAESEKCLGEEGQAQILCLEGFFYQDALDRLAAEKERPMQAGISSRALVQKIPPYRYPLWAIGLGFAVAHTETPPTAFREVFFEDVLWRYFVDGWGLMNVERFGSAPAVERCEKDFAGTPELEVCVWGVGRGTFFFETAEAPILASHPSAAAGHEFAKEFSREGSLPAPELAALPKSPRRTALVAKLQLFDKPVDENLKETDECTRARHILQCSLD